ncbi:hypothetical protein GY45DRAFT_1437237 [Cubamyces sp. BRFM 1775]|nr:hypothetical protein GY45DRAFT_1437237 [Cubamyces sp. BRFM 1775]
MSCQRKWFMALLGDLFTICTLLASKAVSMRYCATIVQCTGEDWNDMTLTLSTASSQAHRQLSVPSLKLLRVAVPNRFNGGTTFSSGSTNPQPIVIQPPTQSVQASTTGLFGTGGGFLAAAASAPAPTRSLFGQSNTNPVASGFGAFGRQSQQAQPAMQQPQYMQQMQRIYQTQQMQQQAAPPEATQAGSEPLDRERERTQVRERDAEPSQWPPTATPDRSSLSVTYRVEGSVSLPSHGKEHKLTIASLSFDTKLQYIEYDLLAGTVNVFMNDSFVTKTSVGFIPMNDSFECVLGVDTALKLSYSQTGKTEHEPRRNFAEPQKTTTRTALTTISNKHPFDIPKLVVRDAIPLGNEDSKLTVVLRKPVGLAETKEGQDVVVKLDMKGEGDAKTTAKAISMVMDSLHPHHLPSSTLEISRYRLTTLFPSLVPNGILFPHFTAFSQVSAPQYHTPPPLAVWPACPSTLPNPLATKDDYLKIRLHTPIRSKETNGLYNVFVRTLRLSDHFVKMVKPRGWDFVCTDFLILASQRDPQYSRVDHEAHACAVTRVVPVPTVLSLAPWCRNELRATNFDLVADQSQTFPVGGGGEGRLDAEQGTEQGDDPGPVPWRASVSHHPGMHDVDDGRRFNLTIEVAPVASELSTFVVRIRHVMSGTGPGALDVALDERLTPSSGVPQDSRIIHMEGDFMITGPDYLWKQSPFHGRLLRVTVLSSPSSNNGTNADAGNSPSTLGDNSCAEHYWVSFKLSEPRGVTVLADAIFL